MTHTDSVNVNATDNVNATIIAKDNDKDTFNTIDTDRVNATEKNSDTHSHLDHYLGDSIRESLIGHFEFKGHFVC